jgi:hypothetical protein
MLEHEELGNEYSDENSAYEAYSNESYSDENSDYFSPEDSPEHYRYNTLLEIFPTEVWQIILMNVELRTKYLLATVC